MKAAILVYLIVVESYAASAVYFCQRDWKHGVYWLLGGSISFISTVLR